MTIWVDVTTSYTWNRPAVGIVRVELEILRHISSYEKDISFFRYDNDVCKFIEVSRSDVVAIVDRITSGHASGHTPSTSTGTVVEQKKPKFLAVRKNEAKHFFVQSLKNFLYFTLSFVDPSYHLSIKLRLASYKLKAKQFVLKVSEKLSTKKNVSTSSAPKDSTTPSTNDSFFGKKDKIISVGAVWNYNNINSDFYRQKQQLELEIFSISYDLIPIFKPHLCLDVVSGFFPGFYNDLCWYSDHIFCISESTKRDPKRVY